MTKLTCTLPVPPSVNHLYATVNGHRTLSARGRSYKAEAGWIVKDAATQQAWEGGERLGLTMVLWFKTRQRRDVSNTVKVVEDTLAEVLSFDDACVDVLHVERAGYDRDHPRCEVTLEVLTR